MEYNGMEWNEMKWMGSKDGKNMRIKIDEGRS